jgi:hypothetical protein
MQMKTLYYGLECRNLYFRGMEYRNYLTDNIYAFISFYFSSLKIN